MTDIKTKLSPPWIQYVNEAKELFKHDPEIKIEYDNEDVMLKLRVDNSKKAEALDYLLPDVVEYGNVLLYVDVIPANGESEEINFANKKELFETAFKNNPVFAFAHSVEGILSNTITYVVFKNRVVQYFNDNLHDIYGNVSTLYQDIASNVFIESNAVHGVCYCTDTEELVGKPLGEWP